MEPSVAQEAAFKELFSREYPRLCQYALAYMQDTHLAEDVVQDTFIKIWEQKRDLVSSPNARFYLITAVRNNCISVIRKQRSQQVHYTDETPEPEPEPFFTATQAREAATEQSRRIEEALNQLPPKCKEVFLLIKLHGMSYKQASEALDISVKTIENQMGKAIKILREFAAVNPVLLFMLILIKKIIPLIGVSGLFSVLLMGLL
jgi:RNA polymerase sigma-70 factor (ECF subfamily)